MCLQKYLYKEKIGLKLSIFNSRLVLINQVFARILAAFGFTCKIFSVNLVVFGVKMSSQKMNFLFLKFISNNAKFIATNDW